MAHPTLRFGCGIYDRIEPLASGRVSPEGIDLTTIVYDDPRELFDRLVAGDQLELAEMSSAEYITMVSNGTSPFVGLPVFTSRVFRHSFICVNSEAGIETPRDLKGKRIGVPLFSMSAAIWCRGLLRDDYGVDLSGVTWVEGSMSGPGTHGTPKVHRLHKPATIEINMSVQSLSELLAEGAIDATLGAIMPDGFGSHERIRRLFPNFRQVERDYYKRTRIHPIMHLVVVRREAAERNPAILPSLYKAFAKAKEMALRRMTYTGAPKSMLPFLHAEVEETLQLFGPDPWPDGIEPNRKTLETAIRYMLEDGLIARPPSLEELFPRF